MISKRCTVSGKVQGVWYRGATRDKALELGLTGRAINCPDGTVEVLVTGPEERVNMLCNWLWEGPPMSRVDNVRYDDIEAVSMIGFHIG